MLLLQQEASVQHATQAASEARTESHCSADSLIRPASLPLFVCSSLNSLRASNQSFVTFHEYSSKSYDQITSLHASRVQRLNRLRESLTEIFLRIRQLRIQLHARLPGLQPWVEDEEAEQRELDALKETLRLEEEEAAKASQTPLRMEHSRTPLLAASEGEGFMQPASAAPSAASTPTSTLSDSRSAADAASPHASIQCSNEHAVDAPMPPPTDAELTGSVLPSVNSFMLVDSTMPRVSSSSCVQVALPDSASHLLAPIRDAVPASLLFHHPTDATYAGRVQRLHLTLLTKLDVEQLPRVRQVAASLSPLPLTLVPSQLRFISGAACDSVVVSLDASAALRECVERLADKSVPLAHWLPHVTLAYVHRGQGVVAVKQLSGKIAQMPPIHFTCSELEFVSCQGEIEKLPCGTGNGSASSPPSAPAAQPPHQ